VGREEGKKELKEQMEIEKRMMGDEVVLGAKAS